MNAITYMNKDGKDNKKLNKLSLSINDLRRDYESRADEIDDPEEDFFDVRKSDRRDSYRYGSRFSKENPY